MRKQKTFQRFSNGLLALVGFLTTIWILIRGIPGDPWTDSSVALMSILLFGIALMIFGIANYMKK